MRYFKIIDNGYVTAVGTGAGGTEITQAEYEQILAVIHNKPSAQGTTDYRLKTNLIWESYAIDPPDPDPELDDADALNILLGGADE